MTMTDIGEVVLVEAARADIALVNDLARFYLYDIARQIGPHDEWVASSDWMRDRKDFSGAWDEGNHPFLIEVGGALAGFCLVDRYALVPDIDWNMSQFFVMGPWVGHGVGRRAAVTAFNRFPGRWQVMQVPENTGAVLFWRRIIDTYAKGAFEERLVPEPERANALRNVMTFTAPPSHPR